ncbi:MAG: hypothetical protein LBE76_01470 [Nitrososphaerota archaeon]|jgi:hypothetical protein|nr:hypothetical protein [Nitrososphaerota archaeon]
MTQRKTFEINTVIVKGDEDSFKAAINRSVLGVTYTKFKRKHGEFHQHSVHNAAITKQICNWLYEYLLNKSELRTERESISDFKLRTTLSLNWDSTGKITGVSGIKLCVYSEIAELNVDELVLVGKPGQIKVDFFFSTIDDQSITLRTNLPTLLESMGKENFDYNEHDYLTDEGRNMAHVFKVDRVPTVVIDDKIVVNPDVKKLRKELEGAFSPKIDAKGINFNFVKPTTNTLPKNLTINKKVSNKC